jgi:diguanylate cyclase (GGDEF)-like protein
MRLRFLRFRTLRGRLAVLYTGMFAAALTVLAVTAQMMIRAHAQSSVSAELVASGSVYDGLWALRAKTLTGTVDVLAHDFGFRTAVGTGDRATIESALATLRSRAGVEHAMLIEADGRVIGASGTLAAAIARLPDQMGGLGRDAVLVLQHRIYRVVVSPVMAPMQIGSVVLALPLDDAEMRSLERLSAIPLTATMLYRGDRGVWLAADESIPPSREVDALVEASRTGRPLATLTLPDGRAFAIAKPLAGPDRRADAALLIRYPLQAALAPYLPLQIGLALAGLIGIGLMVIGSLRLARTITQPLHALDAAARHLEEGARTEVAVSGDDEIGRLAHSFNRMSQGIIDRENQITHLAFHDTLTGLPNRASFRQALDQALARTSRTGEQTAVLCLDLDGFKGVNDTLGHPVGDALLSALGDLLLRLAPDSLVSRLGGDEFAIILSGHQNPDRPRELAQAVLDATGGPIAAAGHHIATGFSIGIAQSDASQGDADQLLKNADLALYRAKRDGRGVFRFFEEALDIAARQRRQLELDLREALMTGQFRLNFQPIYNLKADRVGGFEALIRWHHPTRGEVSPVQFIPVAEETGLIMGIGEWVFHEACRVATGWPDHVRVAINVSPIQFRSPRFLPVVLQALSRSGLPPARLEIEITESVFLDGEDHVLTMLHQLRKLGVRVALDDFGTGYSSLSYLRSFPFDKIKIDRSFVTGVAADPSSAAIVRAIVDLAAALRMEITAEGVEDTRQLACLRDRGCDNIQGYLLSRPVEIAAIAALLPARLAEAA